MMRALALALMLLAFPAGAVQPDEILADTALESRARGITATLRCVVCRTESVDDSNADIARDIRLMVRERLVAGDSDAQVLDFMVERFGEFILLTPRTSGTNVILWVAGPALLLIGLGIAAATIRRRRPAPEALSAEEEVRLRRLLDE